MFVSIGKACIVLSLITSVYSFAVSILGIQQKKAKLISHARQVLFGVFVLVSLASISLVHEFLSCNYQVQYVYEYSNRTLPLFYKLAAFWGGQAGSLLLWSWLLSLFTVAVAYQYRKSQWNVLPYTNLVLAAVQVFFSFLLTFITPPFALSGTTPPDGMGLNPLLQNPGMIWHPPTLYMGYVGYSIPFAFALGAMMSGELGVEWIRAIRRWSLFSWFFLGVGILLGAQWAYVELGWGGYWAWDPVENASLIPWLTGTAFLHSVMVQEKRGMLKTWNMMLIVLTFTLCIFGTFLTRSGVISSVHAFGGSNLGPYFIGFMVLTLLVAFVLVRARKPMLKDEREFDSIFSRESSFLLNNLILLGAAFAVFWGTVYPVISELVGGHKVTVGPGFFNQIMTPIGLVLLALTGIGPLIAWRRSSVKNFRNNFLRPSIVTLVSGGAFYFTGVHHAGALVAFSLCVFVATAILYEFGRGTTARHEMTGESIPASFVSLIGRNRRRYGGYIVHLGIVLMFLGITGSSVFKKEKMTRLGPGEELNLGRYRIRHDGLYQKSYPNRDEVGVRLTAYKDGKSIGLLRPSQNTYKSEVAEEQQTTSEVAIRSGLKEDLYVILNGWNEEDKSVTLKVMVNPLVAWMWIGGILMMVGTHIAVLPERQRREETATVSERKPSKSDKALERQAALELAELALERDLADLEFDYRVGKLSEDDYQNERGRLQATLDQITQRQKSVRKPETTDALEAEIARRRAARTGSVGTA